MHPTSTPVRPEPFFNRERELYALEQAWAHPSPGGQMALVYGRRRLGKTYLLQRFAAGDGAPKPACYYLAEQTTAPAQRLLLATQLLESLGQPGTLSATDLAVSWQALLHYVCEQWKRPERFVLILDEFPYLAEQSPDLPSILQAWWDREGVHSRLMLILCGSHLSAMQALGSQNSPLFGRFNAGILRVPPFRYDQTALFYANSPHYGVTEKLTMYGVLGGTPRYHALVDAGQPMDSEVVNLLLRRGSPLQHEIDFLLGTQQIRDPAPYNAVLAAIASGETQYGRIQQLSATGHSLSFYLRTLLELGWIREEMPFGETSRRRLLYRVADPFLAFWYRFIAPHKSLLEFSDPVAVYEQRIKPYLPVYMGGVFEQVCLQWLYIYTPLFFRANVLQAGRYWSRDGRVEIDIVADLSMGEKRLFAECKWNTARPLGLDDLVSLKAKVQTSPHLLQQKQPVYALFAIGGFSPELHAVAQNSPDEVWLIDHTSLFPNTSTASASTTTT
jgi:AAA+ ATPase superfamily predicted ATPase